MFKLSARELAEKSRHFRYVYYIISTFRLASFRSWEKAGEPNPFVAKTYRHQVSERIEFTEIFEEFTSSTRQSVSKSFGMRNSTSQAL